MLEGKAVLYVEDDAVVAADVRMALINAGARVIGSAPSVGAAPSLLDERTVDAAILDVGLPDGEVFPIVERLRAVQVPFVFYTSHASSGQAQARAEGAPVVGKDLSSIEVIAALEDELRRA
ncbi:response regulator [Parvularcula dongshanensis]|uniref:DNA-binding response OmpR family regulator n=1 Tax=Parvularcula dongshanensis TaxID=1173995 RepID=A0A840HYK5_9PROT|nr:DNA-binding response OmpR family regulator [Parvularcula dongshanensis]